MKRGRPFLICFIGIDGSGKTTQAKALVQVLKARGVESRYVWSGFKPLLIKPFLIIVKAIFFHDKDMFEDYSEYSSTKKRLFRDSGLSAAYKYLVLLDYLMQSIIRTMVQVKIPFMLGKSIVCDRYVHDIVVDLGADLNFSSQRTKNMLKGLMSLFPEPDLIFLLDVPEEVGFQRKSDIKYTIDVLRRRRKIYLEIGKEFRITKLDSNQRSLGEVKNIIQDRVLAFIDSVS